MKKNKTIQKATFSNYRLGDFLIRIKNIARASKDSFEMPSTKLIFAVAKALKEEGYLQDVTVTDGMLSVKLAKAHKSAVLVDLKLVSKPGLRIYATAAEMAKKKSASSILMVSTPKGIMSSKKCVKANIGGEVIAEVW